MRVRRLVASLTLLVSSSALVSGCGKSDVRTDVPASIEGANVNVGESTTNGLATSNLSCKSEGGLLASLAILGGLAAKKDALQACSSKAEKVRVHFAYAGGKTSDVRVADASTPAVAKCVADALGATTLPDSGACIATIGVGK